MVGAAELVTCIGESSKSKSKHSIKSKGVVVYMHTDRDMVEGFLAHELTGAGEFVGAEWNKYSNLVGTNMTHATGKTWQNRNRRQTNKRANLVHSISNSGGWSSTGSTRRYQSQTNWYIWNHIQTANLESAEDNFFSVKDGNKRRNLRDKDMSDLAKRAYRRG